MQIFVTGATGVLGRALVPLLIAEGHRVKALARSDANKNLIESQGAEPIAASLFDPPSLESGFAGCEATFHLATRIPPSPEVRKKSAWEENDRIRREGTRNVVNAALAIGVRTVVYPSFAFVYADGGRDWIDAEIGKLDAGRFLKSTLDAEREIKRFAAAGRTGISLRLALIYGPASIQTRELIQYAKRGIALVVGRDDAYFPNLWVTDAATALLAALRAPSGIYDVADDEPLTIKELAEAIGRAVGRRRVVRPPVWLARLASGDVAVLGARSRRLSNRRFKAATGWAPSVPSAREGWALLAQLEEGEVEPGSAPRPELPQRDKAA